MTKRSFYDRLLCRFVEWYKGIKSIERQAGAKSTGEKVQNGVQLSVRVFDPKGRKDCEFSRTQMWQTQEGQGISWSHANSDQEEEQVAYHHSGTLFFVKKYFFFLDNQ